jgi:hypothetical protein
MAGSARSSKKWLLTVMVLLFILMFLFARLRLFR